jgi:hypothetical protein
MVGGNHQMSKSASTKAIVWICAGALVGYLVLHVGPAYFGGQEDPRSVKHLGKIADEINRSVPVMIDQETELLPAVGAPGMLIYNYRLVSYSAAQLDAKKFANGAQQRLKQNACSNAETRDDFLKKGVTLRYSYYDKDKKHIATVDVTPADCGF